MQSTFANALHSYMHIDEYVSVRDAEMQHETATTPLLLAGVPSGPLYGQLSRGQSVTSANGRVVEPHEVMDPPSLPGPLLLLLDCPSLHHLPSLPDPQALADKLVRRAPISSLHSTVAKGLL